VEVHGLLWPSGGSKKEKAMDDCSLTDLGFFGPKFTLINGREGAGFVQERLDRPVANSQWCGLYKK
jgi:hypothetical protein